MVGLGPSETPGASHPHARPPVALRLVFPLLSLSLPRLLGVLLVGFTPGSLHLPSHPRRIPLRLRSLRLGPLRPFLLGPPCGLLPG